MPQARLPDVNTAYIKYRNEIIQAIKEKNWPLLHGTLHSLNALLPPEYRVLISSAEYDKLAVPEVSYKCNFCAKETDKSEIEVFDCVRTSVERLLVGFIGASDDNNKTWICAKCNKTNKLQKTIISQTVLSNPIFLGVVPNPPERMDRLMDRLKFEKALEIWGLEFLSELEQKMALFRDDHWNRGEEEGDLAIDTSTEESS